MSPLHRSDQHTCSNPVVLTNGLMLMLLAHPWSDMTPSPNAVYIPGSLVICSGSGRYWYIVITEVR